MGRFTGKDILERSKAFSLRIIRLVRTLSRDDVGRHIGNQLLRSGTSIGANLHEADMADTRKDFCNKVNIAQKEAAEAAYWILLIREAELISAKRLQPLEIEAIEIQKICRQIVNATRHKMNSQA